MIWHNFERPDRVEQQNGEEPINHGRFVAQPFERGWGTTVGNALRRALLSSISGAAVTAVRIEGAEHEFSVVPGVVEDVTDIILNLKNISFRCHAAEEPVFLTLDQKGAGEVTAASFAGSHLVEVVDESVHVATLSTDGHLRMTVRVAPGRGYVPAEENKSEDLEIGFIPVDSAHSPVLRANYRVENARLGRRTNYERLVVEVWTNGSVEPEDAIGQAAEMVRGHLGIFVGGDVVEETVQAAAEESKEASILDASIDTLELSIRSMNCLRNADIGTIRDLVVMGERQMMEIRNFGEKSLREVRAKLEAMGLGFGMNPDMMG